MTTIVPGTDITCVRGYDTAGCGPGKISRQEFVAGFDGPENEPEGLWEQEDANDDGFITWCVKIEACESSYIR